jgi:hypothetical protein
VEELVGINVDEDFEPEARKALKIGKYGRIEVEGELNGEAEIRLEALNIDVLGQLKGTRVGRLVGDMVIADIIVIDPEGRVGDAVFTILGILKGTLEGGLTEVALDILEGDLIKGGIVLMDCGTIDGSGFGGKVADTLTLATGDKKEGLETGDSV